MNLIALVATLCLAYSVAAECRIDGKLVHKLFEDYDQPHKNLLNGGSFNRTFTGRDLVLYYKMVGENVFPSVIFSRKKRAFFFIDRNSTIPFVEESNMTDFFKNLFDCKRESKDIHIFDLLPPDW